jgi:VCBS repeat protein/GEVED domain-containing protein
MGLAKRLARVFLGDVSSLASGKARGIAPRSRRIGVEPLEDRRLLSVGGTVDFGDLPDNYGTTVLVDGARHEASGPTLGATRDAEADGVPTLGADGDDTSGVADEDGVTFGTIQVGQLDATATVNVQNAPSGAKLDAWIDFNQDGSFGGAGEQVADTVGVVEGDNVIELDVPSWAVSGETYARFRLSSAGDLGPRGAAVDGEVEDYGVEVVGPAVGGGAFLSPDLLTASTDDPLSVHSADMDGDGDMDVLSASNDDHKIAWYENDGKGDFAAHTITTSAIGAFSVFSADVDSDGDMDVLSASQGDDTIAWYENDGSEEFTQHTIATNVGGARAVSAGDFDRDGDVDVLSGSNQDGRLAWHENDGSENFTSHTIASFDVSSVFVVDMEDDGDSDVLVTSFDGDYVAWYENDGQANFTRRGIGYADGAFSAYAADMDGDGDMDVVSAALDGDKVTWHRNDGDENFSSRTVSDDLNGASSVYAADFDGDGDMDVLASSLYDHKVVWYEQGGWGRHLFTEHTISTTTYGAYSVWGADLDGDDDMDALAASMNRNKVAWYENEAAAFAERTITPFGGYPQSVFAADVDGDGYMDVLSASSGGGKLLWHENDGHRSFTAHTLDGSGGFYSVMAVDIDGDGDTDVLAARDAYWYPGPYHFLAWYENDGNEGFTRHIVTTQVDGRPRISAADMDGDGDIDLLSASSWDNRLAWYENDGEESFTSHSISLLGAGSVSAVDINGDGNLDVLAAFGTATPIAWYENDGQSNFTARTIASSEGASSAFAADVDGDGDTDVLSASSGTDAIFWHENDGSENFTPHRITASAKSAYSVFGADLDGDGDLDVLSNSALWYENDGQQNFTSHPIPALHDHLGAVYVADMDGDADLDVLSAASIAWYEQINTPATSLGDVDLAEVTGIDLASSERAYLFTPANERGILTVDVTFDPALGDVTLGLLDKDGELLQEVSGGDGYLRIDHHILDVGETHRAVLSGSNRSVDLRVANLVVPGTSTIFIHGTDQSDSFGFSVSDTFDVSVNGVDYSFDRDEFRHFRFQGRGDSAAVFHGTAGDESAGLYPGHSIFSSGDARFRVEAFDVSSVTVVGGGGNDGVGIVDSRHDDTLTATSGQMAMRGPGYGTPFELIAVDFPEAHAYAKNGGNDTAILTGSSESDLLKVYDRIVKLIGGGSYNRVKFFENVEVDTGGGIDRAVVNPTNGADVVWAMKDDLRVEQTWYSRTYNVAATGWERAYARANGLDDRIELHDSALNDVFIAKPHKVEMMNAAWGRIERGAEYRICARGFQHVSAIADQGGSKDIAKLYDSGDEGVDVWAAGYVDGVTWSSMSSPTRLLYEALAFEYVGGYGFNGGLGESHGTNRKDHADGVDFLFQYGYWEGEEPVMPGRSGQPSGRGEHAGR